MLKVLFGVTRIAKIRNEGQVRLSVLEKDIRRNQKTSSTFVSSLSS